MSRGGRVGRLAVNLVLLLVSTALACVVLEAVFRILAPQPLGLRFYARDGILLHYPGAKVRYTREEFSSTVAIDSDGLRDREYPARKPPGVFRVLVLGDSFTEGLQVDDRAVWPKVAEEIVRRERGRAGESVQLVNAAVAGFGTADELRYLEARGARWEPDLVLLAFYCGNDVRDNLAERGIERGNGRIEVRRKRPTGEATYQVRKLRSWIGSHSHLYQFLRDRLHLSKGLRGLLEAVGVTGTKGGGAKGSGSEDWSDYDDKRVLYVPQPDEAVLGWNLTRDLLDSMLDTSRELGARFALVVIPNRRMVDEALLGSRANVEAGFELDPDLPGRVLGEWARERNVHFHDLTRGFRSRHVDGSFYYKTDGHWNEKGHAAAAEEIASFLFASGLITRAVGVGIRVPESSPVYSAAAKH